MSEAESAWMLRSFHVVIMVIMIKCIWSEQTTCGIWIYLLLVEKIAWFLLRSKTHFLLSIFFRWSETEKKWLRNSENLDILHSPILKWFWYEKSFSICCLKLARWLTLRPSLWVLMAYITLILNKVAPLPQAFALNHHKPMDHA